MYINAGMKKVKMGMEGMVVRSLEEEREWILSGLLYAEYLLLSDESKEDIKVIVECFIEV